MFKAGGLAVDEKMLHSGRKASVIPKWWFSIFVGKRSSLFCRGTKNKEKVDKTNYKLALLKWRNNESL
jgi:hypothetical protein